MDDILERVRKGIQPSKASMKNVEKVVKRINDSLSKKDIGAECVVGGSFAKNTHLKGDHDVDLFVRFNYSYKDDDISKLLGKSLPFKASKVNGSRDYFQFSREGMDFEVVPVLNVGEGVKPINVTDMSPLHVDFVNKHCSKKSGLNEEIRLLKQFCKANKVYGAESYIQGLSGHVLDILVLYYGSFKNVVLAASSKWGDRVVIDMVSHWNNPLKQLNKSKIQSPVVIVDPVQPDRNAAAAVSEDKFELFKKRCKEFLENPNTSSFKAKNLEIHDLKKKVGEDQVLLFLEVWPYKSKDDVMGAKLRQAYDYVYRKIDEAEWPVVESDWEFLKGKKSKKRENQPHGHFYFVMSKHVKPFTERKGPPIAQKENVKKFTKSHSTTFIRGGRLYARIERRLKTPEGLVSDVVSQKYVSERVKEVFFLEV